MYHEHPLRILRYSAKNIWLLVFPLIRNFNILSHSRDWFYNWLRGAWFDILIIGLILMIGYIKWYFARIKITDSAITHETGIFLNIRTSIPFISISSVTAVRKLHLRPFRAVNIRCDTRAGFFNTADMKFMVTEKIYQEILKKLPKVMNDNSIDPLSKPTAVSVILFSFFFSSGLSGVIYIAAFFFQGGNIARDIITVSLSKISESSEKISRSLLLKIPDAAVLIGILFIGAWLLSFIINILTYSKFHVECDNRYYRTSYGAVNCREHWINSAHINYIDLRQNLIMKFSEAIAVHISCAGYGTSKRSLPVLLPVRKEKNISKDLEAIGILGSARTEFRPKKTGMWNYIWLPAILSACVFPLHLIISHFFPLFSGLSLFAAIMIEIPSAWFIIVKTAAFLTSGISVYDDKIMVKCCKWAGFHTVIADRKKLVKAGIEQTIFQKIGRRCCVALWFEGEKQIKYKIKSLSTSDIVTISQLLDCSFVTNKSKITLKQASDQ